MSEFGLSNTNQAGPNTFSWYTPDSTNQYANYQNSYPTNAYPATTSFDDDPPLLEELGIDLSGILKKSRAILFHRIASNALDDLDMGGALIYIFVLGGLHLLMGKLHFGVILGWSVVHSVILWFLSNQLAGVDSTEGKLDLYNCCCLFGYCMQPIVLLSGMALLLPRSSVVAIAALVCTFWSAMTAARLMLRRCPPLEHVRNLLIYPCILAYGIFALLTVNHVA